MSDYKLHVVFAYVVLLIKFLSNEPLKWHKPSFTFKFSFRSTYSYFSWLEEPTWLVESYFLSHILPQQIFKVTHLIIKLFNSRLIIQQCILQLDWWNFSLIVHSFFPSSTIRLFEAHRFDISHILNTSL